MSGIVGIIEGSGFVVSATVIPANKPLPPITSWAGFSEADGKFVSSPSKI